MTLLASEPQPRTFVKTMRASVVTAPKTIDIREVPLPQPVEGQVRIRLEGCGVCHSNLPPFEGRPWFTYPMAPGQLGHEGWGTGPEVRARSGLMPHPSCLVTPPQSATRLRTGR